MTSAAPVFVTMAWYAIGWETDIGRSLKPFTVCGPPMVAYRRFDRGAVVLQDSCWHRGLSLSMGRLAGDEVECAYHGLRFTPQGRCSFVPGQDVVRLLLDNLMDLTHETFVRGTSIGHAAILHAPFDVEHDDGGVTLTRWMSGVKAPPFLDMQLRLAHGLPEGTDVDRWQIIHFDAPSTVEIDVGVAPVGTGAREGDRSRGISGRVLNSITPSTATSCYYNFGFARNFRLESRELDEEIKSGVTRIFGEDKVILEAQQRALGLNPHQRLRDLGIDSGSVRARRMIDRRLKMEQPGGGRVRVERREA